MTPKNLTIRQGARFRKIVVWNDQSGAPVDVTGWAARLTGKLQDGTTVVDLTVGNGGVAVGTTDGAFTLTMLPDDTAALDWSPSQSPRYDMLAWGPGSTPADAEILLEGELLLDRSVTRRG